MLLRRCLPVCALALAASLLSPLAQAAPGLVLPTDGRWTEILVDDGLPPYTDAWVTLDAGGASYTAASYSVNIAAGYQARLTVVDTDYAGDRFVVYDNGVALGTTGATMVDSELLNRADADAALANLDYSRGVFTLAAGNHVLTGALLDGGVMGATNGALKLEVSAVPEPATVATLLAGLGLIGATLRRRAR